MLANPTAMSGIWFLGSVILFLIIWGITTLSALMFLEANLQFEKGANFDTITTQLLGKGWNIFNGISVAFTLYILTYAYITSGGSITKSLCLLSFFILHFQHKGEYPREHAPRFFRHIGADFFKHQNIGEIRIFTH